MSHRSRLTARLLAPIERFLRVEAASGLVLLGAALVALVWANSPWAPAHARLADQLRTFLDDGLMTIFFLVAGLEIRRELVEGELSDRRRAMLPLCAALGGMLAPALLYLGLARGGDVRAGWGIPTATDIAFAVGALALLGRRVPPALRVFLLALAILDDVGAVVVIAVGYSRGVAPLGLAIAVVGVALVLTLRRLGVRRALGYLPAGALIWWGLWRAGVHPTLAGVLVGMLAPLPSLAATLHPWVAYGILPLFALVNCGIDLGAFSLGDLAARRVFVGVLVGLAAGKPLGIVGASALAVRLRLGALPRDVSWRGVAVAGCVAGIGFTMGILVAELSFDGGPRLAAAKAAVLASSLVGGVGGIVLGRLLLRPAAEDPASTKVM